MAPYPTQKTFNAGSEFPPTTPGRLRIYSTRTCPYAQRTRLVLLHKNIDFETVNVNLKDKPDWFLSRAPLGQVPVLELDGMILNESTASCEWLDDVYTQNRLTPSDPYRKAKDRVLLEYYGKLGIIYSAMFFKRGEREEQLTGLQKHYTFYENEMAERGTKFFGGDQPAMIDFFIWPLFERFPACLNESEINTAICKERFPNLYAWFDVMRELPEVKATMLSPDVHRYLRDRFLEGKPDSDYMF